MDRTSVTSVISLVQASEILTDLTSNSLLSLKKCFGIFCLVLKYILLEGSMMKFFENKKVLLRERKRHTARRVAMAISCYSGGGGSLDKNFLPQSEHVSSQIWCQKFFPLLGGGGVPSEKNFFPSLNMYQAKSHVKNFSLYGGGGSLREKFFSQSEHVSSQIWCQKLYPLLRPGTPPPPPPNLRPGTRPPPPRTDTHL